LGNPITGTWTAMASTTGGFSFAAAPVNGNGGLRTGQGSRHQTPWGAYTTASARSGQRGDFQNIYPYIYSYTYATLRNDAGAFGVGKGPGNAVLTYGNGDATIIIKQGKAKFGGTMRMLGAFTTKVCYFRHGGCSIRGRNGRAGNNWRYDAVGAKAYTTGGPTMALKSGYLATYRVYLYHPGPTMQRSTLSVEGERFPWTTGSVTLTATGRGPHKTVHYAHGYDNRTPTSGEGTIQLVSPLLTRWLQPCCNFETGGIGILRIKFVPEPQTWVMLVAGVSLLAVGTRMRRR
jgi:hypothetical protein